MKAALARDVRVCYIVKTTNVYVHTQTHARTVRIVLRVPSQQLIGFIRRAPPTSHQSKEGRNIVVTVVLARHRLSRTFLRSRSSFNRYDNDCVRFFFFPRALAGCYAVRRFDRVDVRVTWRTLWIPFRWRRGTCTDIIEYDASTIRYVLVVVVVVCRCTVVLANSKEKKKKTRLPKSASATSARVVVKRPHVPANNRNIYHSRHVTPSSRKSRERCSGDGARKSRKIHSSRDSENKHPAVSPHSPQPQVRVEIGILLRNASRIHRLGIRLFHTSVSIITAYATLVFSVDFRFLFFIYKTESSTFSR